VIKEYKNSCTILDALYIQLVRLYTAEYVDAVPQTIDLYAATQLVMAIVVSSALASFIVVVASVCILRT